ncbi:phosphohydrolase [Candidatus Woesearchaeota archaeon CG11_big_fil_rev_8_21_14_0_20_43_8]|nr:MAG: phosphohydrolase [Candidatus Woesearchaeota archaeon CG11_big_fil_rev_8_21_14_0_20_43_8]PIO09060.1 MAG: phosphohydrolase [Candidatus Woesearchaeota archaeon CG08_land_8_20_14_0_20_43_7]
MKGIDVTLPRSYSFLETAAKKIIEGYCKKYPKTKKIWEILSRSKEIHANWKMADYIAVRKLKYNDHGRVHSLIMTANAMKILDLLIKSKMYPDIVNDQGGDIDDAFLIILTAGVMHDFGNQVHRERHPRFSVAIAVPLLDKVLPEIYPSIEKRTIIRGFILHCILTHDENYQSLTIEGSILTLADGTDMTKGRGRASFNLGKVDIHSVSAVSIENVIIKKGRETPIEVIVEMNNSAGIFQIEEILGKKLNSGMLVPYVTIIGRTIPRGRKFDKRVVHEIKIKKEFFKGN